MSANFFDTSCKETPRYNIQFGICDDENGSKAYTNHDDAKKWVAKVQNESEREISFTAIDNCIVVFRPGTKEKESTCDGMLTFADSVFLVELKDQGTGGWINRAVGQLENTMKLILDNHDRSSVRFKKAFACNKKHPRFETIDNELNKRFFKTYGFRIDIRAEIVIK